VLVTIPAHYIFKQNRESELSSKGVQKAGLSMLILGLRKKVIQNQFLYCAIGVGR